MSLKKMAMGLAIAFAAKKGLGALGRSGGIKGLQRSLSQSSGGSGGLGALLGGAGGAGGGGLGSLLGSIGATGAGGGLLGGLAAMAGGSAMANDGVSDDDRLARAEQGIEDEETAAVMVRAMAQAVRADGVIDDAEARTLEEVLGDSGDPSDRAALRAALTEPVDPDGLARDTPRGSESQVYAAALTAIDPDAPQERAFLDRLAVALRMDPAEVRALHGAQGKPI